MHNSQMYKSKIHKSKMHNSTDTPKTKASLLPHSRDAEKEPDADDAQE